MRIVAMLGLSLGIAAVACSGSSDPGIPAPIAQDTSRNEPQPTGGDVEVKTCTGANTTELVHCVSTARGVAATVCGNLERDNTLDVNGRIITGGCGQVADVVSLANQTIAAGVVDGDGNLAHVSQPSTLTLGCGRYRYESWGIDNTLSLQIEGDTVIVIDGDVRIASPTHISLASGARLDFIVRGNLEIDNTLDVSGGTTWLAVAGNVKIASPTHIDGWLVVPNGAIEADNTLDVGALFAGSLRVASPLTIDGTVSVDDRGCTAP